ncbi:hypothetical protein T12_988 [Trichinella patagoniensis]|uniref:Uncharacterized protein n=1 Tax=Trichinella patagoniensis TaxID=990121 RepID=A0A0V1ACX2_9BILA|nr:hypothetical protein T12_988 [Trichinella patagoniensis]
MVALAIAQLILLIRLRSTGLVWNPFEFIFLGTVFLLKCASDICSSYWILIPSSPRAKMLRCSG